LVGKNLSFFFPLIKMQRNKQKIEITMEFTNIFNANNKHSDNLQDIYMLMKRIKTQKRRLTE